MQFTIKSTFFTDRVCFSSFNEQEGIRSYHWITAFFLRWFGAIEDVKVGRKILHLNKHEFVEWTKKKAQELSCNEDCAKANSNKVLAIIYASKYVKEADLELSQETPSYSQAQMLLLKAIALDVPKKSLYERRFTSITYLAKKDKGDFTDQIPLRLETINKYIKLCRLTYPNGFLEGSKLEKHVKKITEIVAEFTQCPYSTLMKHLTELGLTEEEIQQECGTYDDLTLKEIIQQKGRVESEIGVKVLKNYPTFVLYKTACMFAQMAPNLLNAAENRDTLTIENNEAVKQERATKIAVQKKIAKETTAWLISKAEECFNKMEFESCIHNLEDAAKAEPEDIPKQKLQERALALKTLIKWSPHNKVLIMLAASPVAKEKFITELHEKLSKIRLDIDKGVYDRDNKEANRGSSHVVLEIQDYAVKIDGIIDSECNEIHFETARQALEQSLKDEKMNTYFPKMGIFENWDDTLLSLKVEGDLEKTLKKEMILAYHLYQKGTVVDQMSRNIGQVIDFETTYSENRLSKNTQFWEAFKAQNNWEALLKNSYYTFQFNMRGMLHNLEMLKISNLYSTYVCKETPALGRMQEILDDPNDSNKPIKPIGKALGADLFLDDKKYTVFCKKVDALSRTVADTNQEVKPRQAACTAFLDLWFDLAIKILLSLPKAKADPKHKTLEEAFTNWQSFTPLEQMNGDKSEYLSTLLVAFNNLCDATLATKMD